jgi:phytoene dehydrogenase-like protein
MDRGLNPLTWKHQHLLLWALLILAGAFGGLVFGWFVSPFAQLAQGASFPEMLFAWLHYPQAYWPYVGAGALVAGLAYYAADLLTGFR